MSKEHFEQAVTARFLRRVNRFIADIELSDGQVVQAHLANTGRMQELLRPGVAALVRPAKNPARKTAWDLLAVDHGGSWVCLAAAWANDFMREWLSKGRIAGFYDWKQIEWEKKIGNSRFDFAVTLQSGERWLLEVKSVNYVIDGHALFPDAPTTRGRRHVEELLALREEGWNVGVFFVTMGQPVVDVGFNAENDPEFARVMQRAIAEGADVRAFSAEILPPDVYFRGERPIR
ncbi:MAG: DNA/RNA nuclease SfsA [Peptococcaceae bacterium]|nr:DNA/RNA nuclease SfsA [Peptococcaceae bacterium]